MSLRIFFSAEDLTRLTLASAPDPLWELLLSLHVLQGSGGDSRQTSRRVSAPIPPKLRSLFTLAPPKGYSPDFLTPAEASAGLTAGLEALRRTPRTRLRAELSRLIGQSAAPSWMVQLARGDKDQLNDLVQTLAEYYQHVLRPRWSHIEQHFHQDVAVRTRVLASQGIGGLLDGLHPTLTWHGTILELAGDHVHGDLRLEGRGLRLLSSYFCRKAPTVLADPRLPPVLVYPLRRQPAWLREKDSALENNLAALLGPTRADVLRSIAGDCTTTELGKRIGLTASSASYHASILRSAGLIITARTGTSVRHMLTPLGDELLNHNPLSLTG